MLGVIHASAQQPSSVATQSAKLNLSNVIEIVFVKTGDKVGPVVDMEFNSVDDFSDGVTSDDQEILVNSNKDFSVCVESASSSFKYSGSASPAPNMPVSGNLGLRVRENKTGGSISSPFSYSSYNNINVNCQRLFNDCDKGGKRSFKVKYEATPGFQYPAGIYSVDVIYTATQI